jgi:hypothetical protein
MLQAENPIEALAAALHAGCLRDLPEIRYKDRDGEKHRDHMNSLSKEERADLYRAEKETGEPQGPFVEKTRRPTSNECDVFMFPQMWSSTALGYGGIGGQAMTSAFTVVVACPRTHTAAVYFGTGGRLAYLVDTRKNTDGGPNLWSCVQNQHMPSCKQAEEMFSQEDQNGGTLEAAGE